MHCPEKQVFTVHSTPSSQSLLSQHSAQSPPQHFLPSVQVGEASQVPSALQRSVVHGSLSAQSSGPAQALPVPAPVPTLPAAVVELPPVAPLLVSPAEVAPLPAVAVSFDELKAPPPQPLASSVGDRAHASAKTTNLGLKKLTAFLLDKASRSTIAAPGKRAEFA
jgi:hypothetical protein